MASFFVNAGLLAGLAVVALPVLIHLINMLRHKRVSWAAMEFLLVSQKRNRTWVRFKELLLLLMRMAAVAAVVMIVAQPLADASALLNPFGQRTQHIILLDDSYSMADRWAGSTAFDRGKQAVARIASQAAADSAQQDFTVLRFSEASKGSSVKSSIDQQRVTVDFGDKIAEVVRSWQPSSLAASPSPALDFILQTFPENSGTQRIVYLVSDFRAKEWESPGSLADQLSRLQALPSRLKFVRCADAQRPNLTIAALEPTGGSIAAGVPFAMQVTLTNYGSDPLKSVLVSIEEDGVGRPALDFDLVAPDTSETRSFPVNFATAGEHTVTARIASDTVETDNIRHRVVNVPLVDPVLIVDGVDGGPDGEFLLTVFNPGGRVKTGIEPTLERTSWLNNNPLDRFSTIYLTNIERLDPPAIESLEKFVKQGGGITFFLGESSRADFFNSQLYRDGQGLFPLPLLAPTQLLVDRLDKSADIEIVAAQHPIFRVFSGERNTFLSAVTIERFFAAPKSWQPSAEPSTEVLARLRNGSPLAVERRFGAGRVVAITTSAAPTWNNWGRNPSFVVAMLELQSHLTADRMRGLERVAGAPVEQVIDVEKYQRRARFVPPLGSGIDPVSADLVDSPRGPLAVFPDTSAAGVYELQLTDLENKAESRRFALNVDPREGDLALLDAEQLATRLPGVKFDQARAEDYTLATATSDRANISDLLLYALIALLLGEQALAYFASYHPSPIAGRAA